MLVCGDLYFSLHFLSFLLSYNSVQSLVCIHSYLLADSFMSGEEFQDAFRIVCTNYLVVFKGTSNIRGSLISSLKFSQRVEDWCSYLRNVMLIELGNDPKTGRKMRPPVGNFQVFLLHTEINKIRCRSSVSRSIGGFCCRDTQQMFGAALYNWRHFRVWRYLLKLFSLHIRRPI